MTAIASFTNERGCGTRCEGDVYLCVDTSPNGKPLEFFLLDPPVLLDSINLNIAPQGVQAIPRQRDDGSVVHNVFDWVGEKYYPNVADFLEEGRRLGFSRKIPKTFNFELITPESRILFAHRRAWIDNFFAYYQAEHRLMEGSAVIKDCPTLNATHKSGGELWGRPIVIEGSTMCARLYWQDITGGAHYAEEMRNDVSEEAFKRTVDRVLPCRASYYGYSKPEGIVPDYLPALFAWFPIHRVVVIRDKKRNTHDEAVKKAKRAKLPIEVEDA